MQWSSVWNWLKDEHKRFILFTVISGLCLIWSFAEGRSSHAAHGGGFEPVAAEMAADEHFHTVENASPVRGLLPFDPAWVAIILSGVPIVWVAFHRLLTKFNIRAGLLISIALLAAVGIKEYFAAGEVAFIMALGELLEKGTLRKTRQGIHGLIQLAPRTARIIRNGVETQIPALDVQPGDRIKVLPGETIPADGTVVAGTSSIDQSAITGESLPMDIEPGGHTLSGGINQFGTLEITAEKAGSDSTIQRMISLIEQAEKQRAPVVRLADKWATVLVPVALMTAVLVGLYTQDIIRAVTILIVFCPCALALATPTAVMAGIGSLTKRGILVKSGEALENMGRVTRIAFDKTGTLTKAHLMLGEVVSFSSAFSSDDILRLLASIENSSEHPIAKAIVKEARNKNHTLMEAETFDMLPGRGIAVTLGGRTYWAGNMRLMRELDIAFSATQQQAADTLLGSDQIPVWLATKTELIGYLTLQDTPRAEAPAIVKRLHAVGIERVLLLTGDHEAAAMRIGRLAGIDDIHYALLPDDKVRILKDMVDSGTKVAMVGDGINDAPAFKTATVGIAMGGIGSDISVDAADVVLMQDNIDQLPSLKLTANRVLRTITIGICFSICVNLGAIILAANGLMGPVWGALVHNAGSVLVVGNAALLFWRRSE